MNKLRLISIFAAVMLVLNIVLLFVLSKGGESKVFDRPKRPVEMIATKLDFDAEQKEQLFNAIQKHREESMRLNDRRKTLRDLYYGSLKRNQNLSAEERENLIKDLTEIQNKLEKHNFKHFQEIRSICREDQLEKFDQFIDQLGQHPNPKKRRGPHGPPPGDHGPPPPMH